LSQTKDAGIINDGTEFNVHALIRNKSKIYELIGPTPIPKVFKSNTFKTSALIKTSSLLYSPVNEPNSPDLQQSSTSSTTGYLNFHSNSQANEPKKLEISEILTTNQITQSQNMDKVVVADSLKTSQ
jgi:hypothetical protein